MEFIKIIFKDNQKIIKELFFDEKRNALRFTSINADHMLKRPVYDTKSIEKWSDDICKSLTPWRITNSISYDIQRIKSKDMKMRNLIFSSTDDVDLNKVFKGVKRDLIIEEILRLI